MSFTYDAKRIWISNDGLGPRPNRFCAFAQPVAVAACHMILIIFVRGFYNYTKLCTNWRQFVKIESSANTFGDCKQTETILCG